MKAKSKSKFTGLEAPFTVKLLSYAKVGLQAEDWAIA